MYRIIFLKKYFLKRLTILLGLLSVFCINSAFSNVTATATLFEVKGPIGPPSVSFIESAIKNATSNQSAILILQLDTPGGMDSSMRKIIQLLMTSPVPVVTFVSPSGARAASAGTYILYASHVAAMAPGTNIGAATPIQLGGGSNQEKTGPDEENLSSSGESDMQRKIINDAEAYLRSLAQLRGRNVEWTASAVRNGESLSAEEALQKNVIEIIATHVPDLLAQLDGKEIKMINQTLVLQTSGLTIKKLEPDWHTQLLSFITNPNVAYILMLIGIYGLIFEFAAPGTLIPGIIGTISLMLSLYAFQVLPISYAGLALMLLGLVLMIAEVFVTSFGILGIGGGLAFIIGSIFLIDTSAPGYGISPALVGTLGLMNLAFFAFVLGSVIKARKRPVVTGSSIMVGTKAFALENFISEGKVKTGGEIWQARSTVPVKSEQELKIISTDGLVLLVTPLNTQEEK